MQPTVLIVEDNSDLRETLADFLSLEGFETELAGNGEEGLERLHAMDAPCVVLLDLMMPVMDGAEFLHTIRMSPRFSRLPVALMTASPPSMDIGADRFLRKPFRLENLLGVVHEMCDGDA